MRGKWAWLVCIAFLLYPMQAFASEDVSSDLDRLANHIQSSKLNSDWEVIARSRAGKLSESEKSAYLTLIKDRINAKQLSGTELDKTAMVVKALGQDPVNDQNENLIKAIYSDASIKTLMDKTYALTALSTDDYVLPNDALWTPDRLIDALVPLQTSSGGWGWAGDPNGAPDVDTTGMVLTALSHYQDKAKDAIEKGIGYLERSEQDDGGFVNFVPNSNSTAQVIIALSSLGIDPTEGAFDKNGHNPVNSLDQYKSNGGYRWALSSESDDSFSNEQVIQALVAYSLFKEGDQLFNFRVNDSVGDSSTSEKESSTTTPSVTGDDTSSPSTSDTDTTSSDIKSMSTTGKVARVTDNGDESKTYGASTEPSNHSLSSIKGKSKEALLAARHPKTSQHQVKAKEKQTTERVTTITKTTRINPVHVYLGAAFILFGAIGLVVRNRLGGVHDETR
ncbi:prenyltransferase/squalene oxidase repeat-containing protein [Sporolactobacillus kofuensis]|uniref:Prenyltransferase/squalene oxidase repeat-containing protein n=1 Tax=Sporolactobacillus kofuensis TaxID=269672 RepID=A0ABW1WG58_9BACL|nr:hypothetical protein [Sporolactobacillus kofuensis]MCO7177057.1 hypothetical protein [Sporolactobacillus kofuensis]